MKVTGRLRSLLFFSAEDGSWAARVPAGQVLAGESKGFLLFLHLFFWEGSLVTSHLPTEKK